MRELKHTEEDEESYKEKYEKLERSLSFFVDIVLICIIPLLLMLIYRNIL